MKTKNAFAITDHKGFHLTFANGYGISVQWGPGNYCEPHYRKHSMDFLAPRRADCWQADTAEVAVFDPAGEIAVVKGANDEWGDTVCGYLTADQVADLIAKVRALPGVE